MILYTYFRSSSAYRVRIALALKNVAYEPRYVHLRDGKQFSPDYVALNPQAQVPTLMTDDGQTMVQSPAILEWIEEAYPDPSLLPADPIARQRVRALSALVGCDIHPIDNLRVLQYVRKELNADDDGVADWFNHWIRLGFAGLEPMLANSPETGLFCHGDQPTMADIYLVPQVFNAGRFGLALDDFPTIQRIYAQCMTLDAFQVASPPRQGDYDL